MENAGLITYIDNGLLLNPNEPDSSKTYRENSIVGLIAHGNMMNCLILFFIQLKYYFKKLLINGLETLFLLNGGHTLGEIFKFNLFKLKTYNLFL